MRDAKKALVLVEPRVEAVHLIAEAVEPLEERVELAIVQMLVFGQPLGY